MEPLIKENSTPTATISTKQNSPYPQTRGFYEDLSDFSLEDECLFPRWFSSAIKRTPGRPNTPRNEVKTRCLLLRGRSIIITGGGGGGGGGRIGGFWLFHDKIYLIPHKAL